MADNNELTFEMLTTMDLLGFYNTTTVILDDFRLSFHHMMSEIPGRRRVEVWTSKNNQDDKALLWIELIGTEGEYDSYITTDILRSMNEEGIQRLFFFTNGFIGEEDRQILEGSENYVFTCEEIIQTYGTLNKRKTAANASKRRRMQIPTGTVLIKNFLSKNQYKKHPIKIRTSSVPELVHLYINYTHDVLEKIDTIRDIENFPTDMRQWGKRVQFELLPELLKVSNYSYIPKFAYIKDNLFTLVQTLIIYIGAVIEYEDVESMTNYRKTIESVLESLQKVDDDVLKYEFDLMIIAEKSAYKLTMVSTTVILLSLVLIIVVHTAVH